MAAPTKTDNYGYGYGGYKGSRSPVAEAFRVLRTNLQFAAVDKELKVILVTSSSPNEGKSTVVQYLAQTISQTGKKVMALDADLINPTLHRRFDIPNQRGSPTSSLATPIQRCSRPSRTTPTCRSSPVDPSRPIAPSCWAVPA